MVRLVRDTREHPDIRVGSSVRGAIDGIGRPSSSPAARRPRHGLAGRADRGKAPHRTDPPARASDRTPEEVVTDLYEKVFGTDPDLLAEIRRGRRGNAEPAPWGGRRPLARPEPKSRPRGDPTTGRGPAGPAPEFAELSPEVGELDLEAVERGPGRGRRRHPRPAGHDVAGDRRGTAGSRSARLAPRLILDRVRTGGDPCGAASAGRAGTRRRRWRLDLDASMEAIAAARAEGRPRRSTSCRARDWGRPEWRCAWWSTGPDR